jgi:hypothetical protein
MASGHHRWTLRQASSLLPSLCGQSVTQPDAACGLEMQSGQGKNEHTFTPTHLHAFPTPTNLTVQMHALLSLSLSLPLRSPFVSGAEGGKVHNVGRAELPSLVAIISLLLLCLLSLTVDTVKGSSDLHQKGTASVTANTSRVVFPGTVTWQPVLQQTQKTIFTCGTSD